VVHTAGVTTFYPDVSHYQQGLSLAGASACMAKATEGASFKDPAYQSFKTQAGNLGIPFSAYHWVNTNDLGAQAANAFATVGPDVGLMWDAEASGATVPRLVELTNRYRTLGGIVNLVYLPHWFWQNNLGSPSLQPLVDAKLSLVSSNYTRYSETGPGWAPYGGMIPVIWQYSDNQILNGQPVDYNAFKGSVRQLAILFSGTPAPRKDDSMVIFCMDEATKKIYRCDGQICTLVPDAELLNQTYTYAGFGSWGPVAAAASVVGPAHLPAVPVRPGDPRLTHLTIYSMGFFGSVPQNSGTFPTSLTFTSSGTIKAA
jgi:Glycosyl hydrolases family 25